MASSDIIWLNVGGTRFATTRGTLIDGPANNFFTRLLNEKRMIGDAYFIDRDPSLFHGILQYLRNPAASMTREVQREAAFYSLEVVEHMMVSIDLDDAVVVRNMFWIFVGLLCIVAFVFEYRSIRF